MKTRVINTLDGLPQSVASHLQACADEMGIDTLEYRSNERSIVRMGREIEVWYDEDASSSLTAWKAFCKGIGTMSGACAEESIARIVDRMGTKYDSAFLAWEAAQDRILSDIGEGIVQSWE